MIHGKKFPFMLLFCSFFLALTMLCHAHICNAHVYPVQQQNQNAACKYGILLVAFGSSFQQAQISFHTIEEKVHVMYPTMSIRWAFTSQIIRQSMAEKGQILLSPEEALSKMYDEGFTHVAVQSLHTIPGAEYNELRQLIQDRNNAPQATLHITLGTPLLYSAEDIAKVSRAILSNIPKKRSKEQAVVFMGHGTHHPSNLYYTALQFAISKQDPYAFVATVEGWPLLTDILPQLCTLQEKKVWLIPFMSVAGDHVRNDMAGDEDTSWKSILSLHGFEVETVLHGTAEFENIIDVWLAHLKHAVQQLP